MPRKRDDIACWLRQKTTISVKMHKSGKLNKENLFVLYTTEIVPRPH